MSSLKALGKYAEHAGSYTTYTNNCHRLYLCKIPPSLILDHWSCTTNATNPMVIELTSQNTLCAGVKLMYINHLMIESIETCAI